jgi:retron-type reverse transcriptase
VKTYKNLFDKIITFENLLLAANKAAKGKREEPNVMKFFLKLEENLYHLQKELETQTYLPGDYNAFQIYEPKPRMISAAPFRDRVVHHALMNIISPLMERGFIFDSYANRVGKGTHKAINRYQNFLRNYEFVLKCDIKSYFPSIDLEILKSLMMPYISDKHRLSVFRSGNISHTSPLNL